MTLRTNNYLRDIREELLEERDNIVENHNKGNNGIDATLLTDTGSNVSLIDSVESVSYTHLDVYKRQVVASSFLFYGICYTVNCFFVLLPAFLLLHYFYYLFTNLNFSHF